MLENTPSENTVAVEDDADQPESGFGNSFNSSSPMMKALAKLASDSGGMPTPPASPRSGGTDSATDGGAASAASIEHPSPAAAAAAAVAPTDAVHATRSARSTTRANTRMTTRTTSRLSARPADQAASEKSRAPSPKVPDGATAPATTTAGATAATTTAAAMGVSATKAWQEVCHLQLDQQRKAFDAWHAAATAEVTAAAIGDPIPRIGPPPVMHPLPGLSTGILPGYGGMAPGMMGVPGFNPGMMGMSGMMGASQFGGMNMPGMMGMPGLLPGMPGMLGIPGMHGMAGMIGMTGMTAPTGVEPIHRELPGKLKRKAESGKGLGGIPQNMVKRKSKTSVTLECGGYARPKESYAELAFHAIKSSEGEKATVKEIYMWIEDNYPFYKLQGAAWWKNCIRHNLSMKKDVFERHPNAGGPGVHLWSVHSGVGSECAIPKRRRIRSTGSRHRSNSKAAKTVGKGIETGLQMPRPLPKAKLGEMKQSEAKMSSLLHAVEQASDESASSGDEVHRKSFAQAPAKFCD